MVAVFELEPPVARNVEAVDLGSAAFIAVADHHHAVARYQHLVIPSTGGAQAGRKSVDPVDRAHRSIADRDGE